MNNQLIKQSPIIFNEVRVLTTELLAEFYETDVKNIQMNLSRNREKYIENQHYCLVTRSNPCYQQFVTSLNSTQPVYLWTEKGALLHAKSLNSEKAWEIYQILMDTYFRVKELSKLEILQMALESETQLIEANKQLEAQKPAVNYAVKVAESENLIHLKEMAICLGVGEKKFFEKLRKEGILYYEKKCNIPYQRYLDQGYFEVKQRIFEVNGKPKTTMTTFVTGKGKVWLGTKWNEWTKDPNLLMTEPKREGKYLKGRSSL
jgi:phage antirepressor YoqD-like protein